MSTTEEPITEGQQPEEKRERRQRGERGEGGERRGRRNRVKVSDVERGRRDAQTKRSQEQFKNMIGSFSTLGADEEVMKQAASVESARKMMKAGRAAARKINEIGTKATDFLKDTSDKLEEKFKDKPHPIALTPMISIGSATAATSVASFKNQMWNKIVGFIEALFLIGSTFSDGLHTNYRDKFSKQNDYQEWAFALVVIIGSVLSALGTFCNDIVSNINDIFINVSQVICGRDVSKVVDHVFDIFTDLVKLWLMSKLINVKLILFAVIFVTVLSFFLKMDDLPEDEIPVFDGDDPLEELKKRQAAEGGAQPAKTDAAPTEVKKEETPTEEAPKVEETPADPPAEDLKTE
ncbi:hypothetical protein BLNAU_1341 [Blattamonas nauphoetae]|uniref:Uncharacterized protein n=1 Tax=Blattamonas nauphoetae TaxID=2049346 RepID=A0ABQ9YJ32_9EUKA|nr:hypothetical protein BLNAU_1341 [Blattamonas nauphoetae]